MKKLFLFTLIALSASLAEAYVSTANSPEVQNIKAKLVRAKQLARSANSQASALHLSPAAKSVITSNSRALVNTAHATHNSLSAKKVHRAY